MQRLKKGQMPPPSGVYTTCKICSTTKDDCEFKWQNGMRQGLVCRMCDRARKAKLYAEDEATNEATKRRAREWLAANPERATERSKTYRAENIEAIQARRVQYHIENAERINGKSRLWYSENRERQSAYSKIHYENNREYYKALWAIQYRLNKSKCDERMRIWRTENPRKNTAYVRAYNLRKQMRTPAWSERKAILEFYYLCPPGHEVDHIIPLKGRLVSGLHVLGNLQYLTTSENCKKSNYFDPMRFENAQ